MSSSGAEQRDAGLQPERTRLAWRRTTLACSVVAVLALRQVLCGCGAPLETAGVAVVALIWLAFLWTAHRRIRELATEGAPGLAPRAALALVLCTVALAAFGVAVII